MDVVVKKLVVSPSFLQSTVLAFLLVSFSLRNVSAVPPLPPSAVGLYTAIAPKLIAPFSTYNISVFVEERSKNSGDDKAPLQFQALILSEKENYTSQETVSILPGASGQISIQTNELTALSYNLTLKIKDGPTHEIENVTTIFPKKEEKTVILLHTDKSMYKPGERVQFRVLHLSPEIKPLPSDEDSAVEVKILDPEQNVIKIWERAEVKTGLFSAKLQLSSEPVLGDWKIQVRPIKPKQKEHCDQSSLLAGNTTGTELCHTRKVRRVMIRPPRPRPPHRGNNAQDDLTSSLTFTVSQYVLPKFQVTIKLPPFITFNQTKVPVQVQAKYTYGKGVKGECTLTPKLRYPTYRHYSRNHNNEEKDKGTTTTFPIDGSAVKEIDIAHLFSSETKYEQEIMFEASVTESVTGKTGNGTGKVYMYRYPYKIEDIVKTEYLKPGLPFSIIFKILTQDNIPIQDPAPNALKISHGFSYKANSLEMPIPPNGLINLTFDTPTNDWIQVSQIRLTYKELVHSYYVPQKHHSDVSTYMNVKLVGENGDTDPIIEPSITTNSKFTVHVNATQPFSSLNYLILGRGQEVLEFEKKILPSPVMEHKLEINCPRKAHPVGKLIVYIVNENKEIIAESFKFSPKIPKMDLDNYLNINILDSESKTTTGEEATFEPGKNISLKLESKLNSLIALRGVDQSVLLLKDKDVDITQASVDGIAKSRSDEEVNGHRIWGGSNSFQVFDQGGLTILTNAKIDIAKAAPMLYDSPPANFNLARRGGGAKMRMAKTKQVSPNALELTSADSLPQRTGNSEEVARVRTEFPETWLWEEVTLNGTNSLDFHKTIPDTLTSWIISGYSLNTDFGLGVLQGPKKVTVFRPFFLSLNLPYSVVKGEILVLQVLVHNYLPTEGSTSAEITLENSKNQFQFNDKSLSAAKEHKKTVSCPPNSVTSVTFVIVPSEFGSIMLDVRGVVHRDNQIAGDALSQALKVKPPGQQQRRSTSTLVRLGQSDKVTDPVITNLSTSFPKVRVAGADKIKISFISDILGSTIANLDKMLQIPTGCGEQNMLNFVADIVILNYLKATQTLDGKVKEKAINFLETGYQRELTYRHSDGSFSAFGPSDSQGSTWLTAFVVRSFIQAKPHITVDDKIVELALQFLAAKQFNNGGLFEHGKVIHSEMQGGSSTSGVALTAYVVLAFIEASQHLGSVSKNAVTTSDENPESKSIMDKKGGNYSSNIQNGLNYVVSQTKSVDKEDPYAIVLTTYALHLANHPDKDVYFEKLQLLATQNGGLTFWEVNKNKTRIPNGTEHHYPWEIGTRPVSVEMTGYALLTYILRGKVAESFPLVKWLLKERNANGGFHSTQDTVVGLTALAKYAELTKDNVTDIQIKATHGSTNIEVTINKKSAEVLQEFELPNDTSSVQLAASGLGTVLAQLTWSYYVEDKVREPAFAVDVEASANSVEALELNICAAYVRGKTSNMAIIEVNLPSGYTIDKDSLVNLKDVPGYKRYDTENSDTRLAIYLDSITSKQTCVRVTALRSFKVGKQAAAYVSVYDYYDTTKVARIFYPAPVASICDICKENNDCLDNNCL